MKPISCLLFALLLTLSFFVMPAEAQYQQTQDINKVPSHFYTALASGKSYAVNQSDTIGIVGTAKVFNVGGTRLCDLAIVYDDSVNVIVLVQKRTSPTGSWSFAAGDTLNQTGGGVVTGSTPRVLVLRDVTVDKFGGAGTQIRVIFNFQATLCGVTTPTYTAGLRWKP